MPDLPSDGLPDRADQGAPDLALQTLPGRGNAGSPGDASFEYVHAKRPAGRKRGSW